MKIKLFREQPSRIEKIVNNWLSENENITILQINSTNGGHAPAEKIHIIILYEENENIDYYGEPLEAMGEIDMIKNVMEVKLNG